MSTVVYTEDGVALVGGLEWRPLYQASGSARENELRELASEHNASKLVVVEQGQRFITGLYVDHEMEDSAPTVKGVALHSIAATLATMAGDSLVVAALHIESLKRVIVISVEQGSPAIDAIQSVEKAQETVTSIRSGDHGFSGHRLFTNDLDLFPDGEKLDLSVIAAAVTPTSRLQRLPVNRKALLTALLLVVLVCASAIGGKFYWDASQKAARQRAARAADPVPKYRAALAEQIGRLGIPTPALSSWVEKLGSYPVWVAGWELKGLVCTSGQCASEWERRGGTSVDLQLGRPGEVMDPNQSSADKSVLTWQVDSLKPGGISGLDAAVDAASVRQTNLAKWQNWANADVTVQQTGPYVQWPNTAPVPPEVALKSRAIEVRTPFVLLNDVLRETPADVWWSEVRIGIDIAAKSQALVVTLKGNSYVR